MKDSWVIPNECYYFLFSISKSNKQYIFTESIKPILFVFSMHFIKFRIVKIKKLNKSSLTLNKFIFYILNIGLFHVKLHIFKLEW